MDEIGAGKHVGQKIDNQRVLQRLIDPSLACTPAREQRVDSDTQGFQVLVQCYIKSLEHRRRWALNRGFIGSNGPALAEKVIYYGSLV